MALLFHRQNAMYVDDMIGMTHDSVEFFLHVTLEGGSDIDMMTGDV
jgi:hypothetical protein